MSRGAGVWIGITMALGSAASMALEIVAGRLLAPYVGMSLYTWTAIIAVVLTGLSLGHWLGGWLGDRTASPARLVGVSLVAAALGSFASLFVLRLAAPEVLPRVDPLSGIGLLSMAAFFLPSMFAGILSPVLTRMAIDGAAAEARGRVLGRMFALGALGAILGTVGAGFWLIAWVGSAGSVALITGLYLVLAVPFFGRLGRAMAVLMLAAPLAAPFALPAFTSPCTVESSYYCIRIDDFGGAQRPSRVMALDHLVHGINDREDPELLISPYAHLIDEMLAVRTVPGGAPDAYFIGGGAYTLPRAWASRYPEGRHVVAEIDPAVTALAAGRMWVDPAAFEVIHGDGRIALSRLAAGRRFDAIVGDAFHDVSIPQHLVTDEFHAEIAARLKPGGFYAVNVIEALRRPPFLLSFARTLELRFANVELWLNAESLGPGEGRATWVVVASDSPTGRDRIDAARGFGRTWLQVPLREMLKVIPEEELVILTDDHAPVDRLMRHVLLDPALAE